MKIYIYTWRWWSFLVDTDSIYMRRMYVSRGDYTQNVCLPVIMWVCEWSFCPQIKIAQLNNVRVCVCARCVVHTVLLLHIYIRICPSRCCFWCFCSSHICAWRWNDYLTANFGVARLDSQLGSKCACKLCAILLFVRTLSYKVAEVSMNLPLEVLFLHSFVLYILMCVFLYIHAMVKSRMKNALYELFTDVCVFFYKMRILIYELAYIVLCLELLI